MNEKLSALMDNELDELETRRLLRALEDDSALRDRWGRYHAIRAVLQRETLAPESDIATRVRDRLAAESTPARTRAPFARIAGQLALAASVAAVAILGARWWLGSGQDAAPVIAQQEAAPVEYLRASTTRWDAQERDAESRLNAYLVEHSEFAPAAGVNGMLPYVRVVGYDSRNGGGTTSGTKEVERRREQTPRATPGADADDSRNTKTLPNGGEQGGR